MLQNELIHSSIVVLLYYLRPCTVDKRWQLETNHIAHNVVFTAKVPPMPSADKRREDARKGMAKLRAMRKGERRTLMAQIESLELALEYLKSHPDEQHQAVNPFVYA